MAEKRKGAVARWLEGKEFEGDVVRYAPSVGRFRMFWETFKGRFGRLILVNFLILLFFLPLIGVLFTRIMSIGTQQMTGPWGSGLGVGYPIVPAITGLYELTLLRTDLVFFGMLIPCLILGGIGIAGGVYLTRNLLRTAGIFVFKDFWRGIKRSFWSVFEAALIFGIVLFLARYTGNLSDYYAARSLPMAGWLMASKVIGYLLVALFIPICLWIIAIGTNYKIGPWARFKNAFVMAFSTFPQTVLISGLTVWPVFLVVFSSGLFVFIGLFIVILFAFSYACMAWMCYAEWAFDKFVSPAVVQTVKEGEKPKLTAHDQVASQEDIQRLIFAHGKSDLASRPIRPVDDGAGIYRLPEKFSRDDLKKLKESKANMQRELEEYVEAHKNDTQYVEYNRLFEERERALSEEKSKKKKKSPKPPKPLYGGKKR